MNPQHFNTTYVSRYGIMHKCDFYSNDSFVFNNRNNQHNLNYLNAMFSNNTLFDGAIIYIPNMHMHNFILNYLNKINKMFILVSGISYTSFPNNNITRTMFDKLMNNQYLIKCFSENLLIKHPKLYNIPIGIDYHSIYNRLGNHNWRERNEGFLPIEQENILKNINLRSKPFYNKKKIIYINFTVENDKYNQRTKALNIIPKNLTYTNLNIVKRVITWNTQSEFAFGLSPCGVGVDCHRTWEILCLGSIPIVMDMGDAFNNLFNDLPVLIVKKWEDITEELLNNTLNDFKQREFNYDKLTLNYWINLIKS